MPNTDERASVLAAELRAGRPVSDRQFDALYPREVRAHSRIHFTPVKVALLAREWLGNEPATRLLDVGSGAGKFCHVVAASGPGKFTGIEQRPNLHRVAEATGAALGLRNASFVCGRMEDFDWRPFNAFYFFNPFYERIAYREAMDDRTPPHAALFFDFLKTVRVKLDEAKSGARVFTYHGMGGRLPTDWSLVRSQSIHTDELQLWVKA